MDYFMGIDLGADSVKALLINEDGEVVAATRRACQIEQSKLNYAEQDMGRLWNCTKDSIQELVGQKPEISRQLKGIGLSGQMRGLVMIDKEGKLIRNAIVEGDQRSQEEIHEIYQVIPKEEYKNVTFSELTADSLLSSLLWVRKHEPANFERIHKIMMPKDYIRYCICGELGTDSSDASATGIFDIKNRQWSWDFMERLKLDSSMFPICGESYEIAGRVSMDCCQKTWLSEGIPVVYGGGATFMQAVGNGIIGPELISSHIGMVSQLAGAVAAPVYDPEFRTNTFCHVKENLWLLTATNLSGGNALNWLDGILKMKTFDDMMKSAKTVAPGSDDLLFLPYLSGKRMPNKEQSAKGIYFGLTFDHGREHMVRSVMEGIVLSLRNSMELVTDLGVSCKRVIASGVDSGMDLFLQMQADVFQREIYTNKTKDQACAGAAITAAVGVGYFKNFEAACNQLVHLNSAVYEPDRENCKVYEEQFYKFQQLYEKNKELF